MMFLFAPLISAQNTSMKSMDGIAVHNMAMCESMGNCATNIQQCCVNGSLSSFYFELFAIANILPIPSRISHSQLNEQTLLGIKSMRYRPPIMII